MLTYDRLKEVLDYDPETGIFTWLIRTARCVRIGTRAGVQHIAGYRQIHIDKERYYEHRVVFLWMTGKWPSMDMDHIDGKKDNNAWCNLRQATKSQNKCNTGMSRNNTSGFKGVTWAKDTQKWQASVCINRKLLYLGQFHKIEDAARVYDVAALEHHGDFAVTNESLGLFAS